jgi:hypothetical protein
MVSGGAEVEVRSTPRARLWTRVKRDDAADGVQVEARGSTATDHSKEWEVRPARCRYFLLKIQHRWGIKLE